MFLWGRHVLILLQMNFLIFILCLSLYLFLSYALRILFLYVKCSVFSIHCISFKFSWISAHDVCFYSALLCWWYYWLLINYDWLLSSRIDSSWYYFRYGCLLCGFVCVIQNAVGWIWFYLISNDMKSMSQNTLYNIVCSIKIYCIILVHHFGR